MNQIKENGFTFDVGPTIVMMPEIYREVFEFAGVDPNDYIPMEKVDPMLQLYFAQDEPLTFSNDLVELTKTLEALSEEDAQGYFAFLADIYKRYVIAKESFITKSFRTWRDFYNPKSLWAGLKLRTFSDAYSSISKFVKDDRLRKSLAFQTLYIGVSLTKGRPLYDHPYDRVDVWGLFHQRRHVYVSHWYGTFVPRIRRYDPLQYADR